MASFMYVKFVNDAPDGINEIKVHVSKFRRFEEILHHPLQEYKINLENGSVELVTILFMAKSEEEIDKMIAKGHRIRQSNKKYRKTAIDTTDSEVEDKEKEILKRNYSKQPANALSNRLKLLEAKKADNNIPEEPPKKKSKISVTKKKKGKEFKAPNKHPEKHESIISVKEVNRSGITPTTEIVSENINEELVTEEVTLNRGTLLNKSTQLENRKAEKVLETASSNINGMSTTTQSAIKRTTPSIISQLENRKAEKVLETASSNINGMSTTTQSAIKRTTPSIISETRVNIVRKDCSHDLLSKSGSENHDNNLLSAELSSVHRETSFHKLMVSRNQGQSDQSLHNAEKKNSKLTSDIKMFKELLHKEREKTLQQERKINLLEEKLEISKKNFEEIGKELKKTRDLNQRWQNLGIDKCATMDAIFNKLKKAKILERKDLLPAVGYIKDDKSSIHMGRDEWLPYETYILAMNGVTFKNRKTFPKNLCVGIFGYDLLSKSTISGRGSNRNSNTQKPDHKLDANKLLAIRGTKRMPNSKIREKLHRYIYRHFLINHLHLSEEVADQESYKVNECISRKISSVKELHKKPMKPSRPLLGDNVVKKKCSSTEQEIPDEVHAPSADEVYVPSADEVYVPSVDEVYAATADQVYTPSEEENAASEKEDDAPSEEEEDAPSEEEEDAPSEEEEDAPSEKEEDSSSEKETGIIEGSLIEPDVNPK